MKKTPIDIEKTALLVERISRNRLILAIALIVDGILFLLNPGKTVEGMGRAIAISLLLAAGVMIIAKISVKEPFSRFLPALILLAAGGLMYFFPDVISAYFRIILALLIIINGSVNLLSILGLSRAQGILVTLKDRADSLRSRLKKPKDFENGIQEQTKRYIRPLYQVVSESEGHKVVSIVTNVFTVILGILLLVKADLSITIFGVIFIYVGFSDFLLAFRTRKISEKLRDKQFREILIEEADENENQAERRVERASKDKVQ